MLDRLLQELKPAVRESVRAAAERKARVAEADAADGAGNTEGPAASGIQEDPVAGKTFVVTGKVFHFANRDALKEFIADRGGKVTGSVSAKTDYLINNDVTSTSSKNKKAAQLGIPILSEEDFLEKYGISPDY
jgi:DNA ligase (NAD+)